MTSPNITEELNTMFAQACEYHTQGDFNQAKEIYLRLLQHVDAPLLRYNLGLVFFDMQQFESAKEHFIQGLNMQPDEEDMLFNLAITYKSLGDLSSAISVYRQLVKINNSHIDGLYNLGGCFRDLPDTASAIECYEKVVNLNPEHSAAINNLAFTLHRAGRIKEALQQYKLLLKLRPEDASTMHMVAALEGENPEQPPVEYVKEVFDNYSETFEESLIEKLEYSVPEKLFDRLSHLHDIPSCFDTCADLGCGTGLSGIAFREVVNRFHGIDISHGMIAKAQEKDIYSRLTVGNIIDILNVEYETCKYSLFIAADVFTYMGDLDELIKLVSKSSHPSAVFCFSTEHSAEDEYSLKPSGRYGHNPSYIRKLLSSTGWEILLVEKSNLRKEKGDWIRGDLWIAKRQ